MEPLAQPERNLRRIALSNGQKETWLTYRGGIVTWEVPSSLTPRANEKQSWADAGAQAVGQGAHPKAQCLRDPRAGWAEVKPVCTVSCHSRVSQFLSGFILFSESAGLSGLILLKAQCFSGSLCK